MIYNNMKILTACKTQFPDMTNNGLHIWPHTEPYNANRGPIAIQGLLRRIVIALAILLSPFPAYASSANLTVITDIAPIHSLASMVKVRQLSSADLVIFIDEDFTPPLTRQINAINKDITRLELNSTLQASPSGAGETHSELEKHGDLHTWLDPRNAIIWLQHIASALAELDPANANAYSKNAQASISLIKALEKNLAQMLKDVRTEPYLVYHDAYQHFATAFNLAPAESIAISDARKPGARRLAAMRKKARSVTCVFSESQHSDALINTVTVGLNVRRGILDPIGSNLNQGPTLYTSLLSQLADSFKTCLGNT